MNIVHYWTILAFCVICLNANRIDPSFLASLFTPSGLYNVIKKGYSEKLLNSDMKLEREIRIPAIMEEQCIIECLKNMHCSRYSFNGTQGQCKIRMQPLRRKYEYDSKISFQLKDQIGVDLQMCIDSTYCTSEIDRKMLKIENSLCDPAVKAGDRCQFKIYYEVTEWSEWTSCSVSCDEGLRKRRRNFFRRYFDDMQNKNITELINKNDWICRNKDGTTIETKQVEKCMLRDCSLYTEWSEWSSCSRVCSGFRNRNRSCLIEENSKHCTNEYLHECEPCGLVDCSNSIISKKKIIIIIIKMNLIDFLIFKELQDPSLNATSHAMNLVGFLTLFNTDSLRVLRLFTYSPDGIENIARVACNEFGFNGVSWVVARSANDIRNQYKGKIKDYFKYINERSLNGLKCTGSETSIKDCHIAANATLETNLFELEMECIGRLIF